MKYRQLATAQRTIIFESIKLFGTTCGEYAGWNSWAGAYSEGAGAGAEARGEDYVEVAGEMGDGDDGWKVGLRSRILIMGRTARSHWKDDFKICV